MILRHAFARYRGDHDPDMTELLRPLKLDNGQGRVVVGDHRDPLEAVGMGTAKLREPVIIGAQQRPFELGVIDRSEEHTSELQSLMRISYAVFCLNKKKQSYITSHTNNTLLK